MFRIYLYAFACLSLGGCVTNTLSTQNAQVTPVGAALPTRALAQNAAPSMTPAARLASARMITVNKTTTAGATLMLATPQSLAKDCSSLGQVDVKIVTPPDHGIVYIEKGMAFPNYSPGDAPYLCNARKSPATLITYRAASGYSGQDTAAVQIFFPDGHAPTMLFHLEVR